MKKLLASGAALFIAAAAAPVFASDVTRDDVRASREQATTKVSRDEACACPMHASRSTSGATRPSSPQLENRGAATEFTDRG